VGGPADLNRPQRPALTGAAAVLDRALIDAVAAAAEHGHARLDGALDRLGVADPHHVQRVLAAAVRPALELRHPDGVDGDDLAVLLEQLTAAYRQDLEVDPLALAVVLTGAFGIALGDPDQPAPQVAPSVVVRHAVLVLAHLVPDRRRLRALVDLAWVEIARADHQD
jgi:hypothetical protein